MEDIPAAADWLAGCMNTSRYPLDYSLESFCELDRFFEEQTAPGGVLAGGHPGSILFAVGAYVGQTLIRQLGGVWETDDADPQGEVNIACTSA